MNSYTIRFLVALAGFVLGTLFLEGLRFLVEVAG